MFFLARSVQAMPPKKTAKRQLDIKPEESAKTAKSPKKAKGKSGLKIPSSATVLQRPSSPHSPVAAVLVTALLVSFPRWLNKSFVPIRPALNTAYAMCVVTVSHSSHGQEKGLVLVLGQGDVGQLGLGEDVMERKKPALVPLPEGVVQVAAGGMHTVCVSDTGSVSQQHEGTFCIKPFAWYTRLPSEPSGCSMEGILDRLVSLSPSLSPYLSPLVSSLPLTSSLFPPSHLFTHSLPPLFSLPPPLPSSLSLPLSLPYSLPSSLPLFPPL